MAHPLVNELRMCFDSHETQQENDTNESPEIAKTPDETPIGNVDGDEDKY